ncbi:hypothetical protein MMC07_003067 [Pseudocyphellaria aurata]|nr:hypothetical protein [Pseudocyphellaria aurata]
MAEVARLIEAPLKSEHYSDHTFSPRVEQDLSARIRTLLAARDGYHPSKAPYPSPDSDQSAYDPDGVDPYYPPINPRSDSFSVPKTIAKLALLEPRVPTMVPSRYDGPAGQIEDNDTEGSRDPSSLLNSDQDALIGRLDTTKPKAPAGLSYLASEVQKDRAHRRSESLATLPTVGSPSRNDSISSKRSTRSRMPAYALRTVPPHSSHLSEAPLKPEVQHIPGSFHTESQASTPRGFQTPPEAFDARSISEYSIAESVHPYVESGSEMHSRAVEALTKARGHDSLESALHSKSLLRREPSLSTLGSTTSTAQSYRPPSKLFVGQSNFSEAAEPVMTSGNGEGHRYSESFTPSPLSVGKKNGKGSKAEVEPSDAHTENPEIKGNHSPTGDFIATTNSLGSPLPELLDQLPPVTKVTVDEPDGRQLTVETAGDSEHLPMMTYLPSRRTTALYLPEAKNSSVDPSSEPHINTTFGNSEKKKGPVSDVATVLGGYVESPSASSQSLSPFGSAASGSSVISLRSGLQISSTPHANVDKAEQASRVRKSPSLASLKYSQSSGQSDEIRLLKKSNTNGRAKPEPKEHWIRTFLAPSSSSKSQANLTARPSRRPSSSGPAIRGLLEKPSEEIKSPSFNEPKDPFHLHNAAKSEEKITKYQDQNREASFKGAIQDLEKLLKEALHVANLGTDHAGVLGANHTTLPLPERVDNGSRQEKHFVKNPNGTAYPGRSVAPTRHQSIALTSKTSKDGIEVTPAKDKVYYNPDTFSSDVDPIARHSFQNTQRTIPEPAGTSVRLNNAGDSPGSPLIQDWAFVKHSVPEFELKPLGNLSSMPQQPDQIQPSLKEQSGSILREHAPSLSAVPEKSTYANRSGRPGPVIQPRTSSAGLRSTRIPKDSATLPILQSSDEDFDDIQMKALQPSGRQYRTDTQYTIASNGSKSTRMPSYNLSIVHPLEKKTSPFREIGIELKDLSPQEQGSLDKGYSLKNRRHFSIREGHGFSLSRSHRRAPIARDWSKSRKRYVATVTCMNTALMGLIIGTYAGEVPAIQYAIVDEHHYTILGNVVFFLGLAISTALFWPLPLLHGRNPYTRAALALLLPLQFPQALAVDTVRSPYVATYRVALLLPRAVSGVIMGFANVNFKTTLLDLFGASLQSSNPHQETVNTDDVRRHGGGMGIWLGIWTWCSIGSIGVGFFIGAAIIDGLDVSWGFWITIILTAFTLLLNVLVPEVRRSAYRRSMAEVRSGREVSRRIARGEIKMHIDSTGPIWWGEELFAGYKLSLRMLKQPGFFIISLYIGWIYGQIVMVIVLLGALMSKYYRFHPVYVGLCVAAIPIGALLAIPFQKASLFSRSRKHAPRTDSMTVRDRVTWSSHLVRRAFFMIALPFAGMAYTLASGGIHTHFMIPTIFAGLIGFLSNLAIAECNGIIMETYDTSDLQPGMTGRRRVIPEEIRQKMTNFSCFPRVSAAFAVTQSFAFVIAAAATGCGGVVERRLGAQTTTAVVAAVLLLLTALLIGVLWRFKVVQIIPSQRFGTNVLTGPENEWKPIIIGRPSGTTRRMSLLELGKQSRWTEIRRRNKLTGPEES